MRLLSSAEHLTSQSLCISLASAVVGALSQWKTEPEAEVEVCTVYGSIHTFSMVVIQSVWYSIHTIKTLELELCV